MYIYNVQHDVLSHAYSHANRIMIFRTTMVVFVFLTVTCSCCPYLYFGSAIMLVTYFVNFRYLNDHYLGKSCSFGSPRVPFVNCRQFMYLVISLLVLRAGCGI